MVWKKGQQEYHAIIFRYLEKITVDIVNYQIIKTKIDEWAFKKSPSQIFDYPYLIRGSSTPYSKSATKFANIAVMAIIMNIVWITG